ncbi:MAG: class I SAM-dependent methyltransferase [Acidobacteriota bacterium]
MEDAPQRLPATLEALEVETERLGFDMASGRRTGALLAQLAASKPGGSALELGTGTGLSAAWILDGLDAQGSLISVDTDPDLQEVARRALGDDARLRLVRADAAIYLTELEPSSFDLIFADAWPGKFELLEETLALLSPGGFYVIDDLLPQPNWPEDHAPKVPELIDRIESLPGYRTLRLSWCTGLLVAVRESSAAR